MRFDLSEDVEFFRATASRFIADELPLTASGTVRKVALEQHVRDAMPAG